MAVVQERKKDAAARFDTQVDEQIAQATNRIRVHDVALGGITLAAMGLVYATAMVLLDRYLVLPEWVRQLSLAGFLVTAAAVTYLLIVRPLRRDINPLYAAVKVERTIDDAKNSVAGYVDAKTKESVHPTVRAAMGARAAKSVLRADLNRAIDHRNLVYAGGVGVVFLLALIILFFVFGFTQFASVLGRTFLPFSSDPIATRTQLTITKPDPADATITAGQTVVIGVEVRGRIPDPDQPDRVRVMIRHNPADPTYVEFPLERGESSRHWQVRVPDYLVQNGFWYKVAAGDAETTEHRVIVRSLPTVAEVVVNYDYPKYLNYKPKTSKDTRVEAPRGTKITLTAKANRNVEKAVLVIEPDPATGAPPWAKVEGRPAAMRFQFRVTAKGTYRIEFTAAGGETNGKPLPDEIHVTPDDPPEPVIVVKPEQENTPIPANGQLMVDGTVGDDHGIDTVTLRVRVLGPKPVELRGKPFLNNDNPSFRRTEPDGRVTWPAKLEYKDSVDFKALVDADGKPFKLAEGMEVEYWLEATDNRHDATDQGETPSPQTGESKRRKVKIAASATGAADQKKQDQQRNDRKTEENQANQEQQKKLDAERRDPQQQPGDQPNEPQQGMEPKSGSEPKNENPPKKDEATPPKKTEGGEPEKKDGMNPTQPMPPMGAMEMNPAAPKMGDPPMAPMPTPKNGPEKKGEPMPKGMDDMTPGGMPMMPPNDGMNQRPMGPQPPAPKGGPNDGDKAEQFAKEIDKQEQEGQKGGEAKPEQPQPKAGPMAGGSDSKPNPKPMAGDEENKPKPDPKPMDMANPMGGTGPSETKPDPTPKPGSEGPKEGPKPPPSGMNPGDPKQNPDAAPKPDPSPDAMARNGAQDRPSPEPKKEPGTTPPMPAPGGPQPKDPKQSDQNQSAGGTAKPESEPKPESGMNPGAPQPKEKDQNAKAGGSKRRPENDTGTDKAPPTPKDDTTTAAKPNNAGEPKPEQPDAATQAKRNPKDEPMGGAGSQPKAQPKAANPGEPKPADPKDDMAKGMGMPDPKTAPKEKPVDPKDNATAGRGPEKKVEPKTGPGSGEKKIDPKDVVDTAKDLNNPDPSKQKAAQDKLDKTVGPENRKEIEKSAKDLNSPDMNTKAAAEKTVEDIANKAAADQKKNNPTEGAGPPKLDPKDLEKAVKGLNSPNEQDRKKAEEQLKNLSPEDRKKAEEIAKGLNSKDPKEQQAAQQQLDDMKKQAEAQGNKEPDPKLTRKDVDDLKGKLQDLKSPDKATREKAEKEFDQKLGKENREKLQDQLENGVGTPEAKAESAKQNLEEMARNRNGGDQIPEGTTDPTRNRSETRPDLEAAKEDARNRLKTAELQLEKFESSQYKDAAREALGWSDDDVKRLLDGKRKEVDALKARLQDLDDGKMPAGRATTNANDARKLDPRSGPDGPTGRGGEPKPAPGYGKAQQQFNDGVRKIK